MVVWDSSVAGSGGTNLFSDLGCHFIVCLMQNSGICPRERDWITSCGVFLLFSFFFCSPPNPFLNSKYWLYFTAIEP